MASPTRWRISAFFIHRYFGRAHAEPKHFIANPYESLSITQVVIETTVK
jgi:hypothetical protein